MRGVNEITGAIIGDSIAVHRELGPGLLESVYEVCVERLLVRRGLRVERQVAVPVVFQGEKLECGFRLDMVVEGRVIVEVKSVAALAKIHLAQMLTYLKLTGCEVGLLINFNVPRLMDGVQRVVPFDGGPGGAGQNEGRANGDTGRVGRSQRFPANTESAEDTEREG